MCLPPSRVRLTTLILAAAPLAACLGAPDPGEPIGDTQETFSAWKASLPRDPNDGAYLVDGDLGIRDEVSLERYFASREKPSALIVSTRDDGGDDRWPDGKKEGLTYCVSRAFGDDHDAVVTSMAEAASSWASAADVRFVYVWEQDGKCRADNKAVVFQVLPAHNTPYNGRSFLPSLAARGDHALMIDLDNVARAAPKTLTGVLLHELGHVLGFRHEHTRPEANGVCVENPHWRPLTPYDARSVMHYNAMSPCEGGNTGDYVLTERDISGARSLYGDP